MTNCRDIEPQLSAFVDDALDRDMRQAVAGHVRDCDLCAGLVRDLESLRRAAGSLAPVEPPARVTAALMARVRQTSEPAPSASWWQIAAAVAMVAAGVFAVLRLDRPAMESVADVTAANRPGNAPAVRDVETGGDDWKMTLTRYEQAIATLETATARDASAMDPAMASTLKSTLAVVDRAIDESRAAVDADPESAPARDSLSDSLRRKVSVLEAAAGVIADSPKGE